jgi:hypothetical protein
MAQKNVILHQEPTLLGSITPASLDGRDPGPAAEITGVVVRDLEERGRSAKGLSLFGSYSTPLLDADELPGLVRATKVVAAKYQDWEKTGTCSGQRVRFDTKSGIRLELSCFYSRLYCSVGDGGRAINLNRDGLKELERLLEKADDWLRTQ